MARDQGPMTDEQLAAAQDDIQDLREDVRNALAAALGGDPDDYRADRAVADGGDADT
ncbi:MAG: hypothetical protein ACOCQY_02495 [Halorhabdus sp.]